MEKKLPKFAANLEFGYKNKGAPPARKLRAALKINEKCKDIRFSHIAEKEGKLPCRGKPVLLPLCRETHFSERRLL